MSPKNIFESQTFLEPTFQDLLQPLLFVQNAAVVLLSLLVVLPYRRLK